MLLIYGKKELRNQQISIRINMKLATLTKESYLPGGRHTEWKHKIKWKVLTNIAG